MQALEEIEKRADRRIHWPKNDMRPLRGGRGTENPSYRTGLHLGSDLL